MLLPFRKCCPIMPNSKPSQLNYKLHFQVKIWFQNRRMKWRNSKERELIAHGGCREQTLPTKQNPNPDLSDPVNNPATSNNTEGNENNHGSPAATGGGEGGDTDVKVRRASIGTPPGGSTEDQSLPLTAPPQTIQSALNTSHPAFFKSHLQSILQQHPNTHHPRYNNNDAQIIKIN